MIFGFGSKEVLNKLFSFFSFFFLDRDIFKEDELEHLGMFQILIMWIPKSWLRWDQKGGGLQKGGVIY